VVGKLGCYLDDFEGLRFLFTTTPYLNLSKRYPKFLNQLGTFPLSYKTAYLKYTKFRFENVWGRVEPVSLIAGTEFFRPSRSNLACVACFFSQSLSFTRRRKRDVSTCREGTES
jgi:hypothetical protein